MFIEVKFQQSIIVAAILLLFALPLTVSAKEAVPLSPDPVLEKRVNDITSELRCLVCQNQTIADSHAELAVDLKNQVRGMVAKGQTRDQIVDYMVKRYGDFVLFRPPMKPTTYLLWVGPFILLVLGLVVLMFNLKKRKVIIQDAPLSEQETAKLDTLLHAQSGTASEREGKPS
jgi:cytochrome c-type biogenesis protein CcmH